ncbi:MAG: thioredoxin fold domain-containing protein [Sulfuricaulis sp.]
MNPITALARALAVAFAILLNTAATADAAPPSSRADAVLTDAPKATWIAEGQGARVVYIFFDPNCPSCQLLYQNLRSFVGSHDLQLRWIPVAVVNVTSLGKAAAILEAPDPVAALRRNEEHYDAQAYAGGIAEDIPSADTERKVRANERLLNGLDIPVVPSLLFAAKDGRAILIQGALSPLALRKVFARLP